jgi:uncharacterized protein
MSRVEGHPGGVAPAALPPTTGAPPARGAEPKRSPVPEDRVETRPPSPFDAPAGVGAVRRDAGAGAGAGDPRPTFAYAVQKGDTLYGLGRRFGFETSELVAANPQLRDPNVLAIGQVIRIPLPQSVCWQVGLPGSLRDLGSGEQKKVDQLVSDRSYLEAKARAAGWSWSDVGHTVLDIAGFVPGWGEAADVANAGWYLAEGKHLEAGLSLISMIPVVGDVIGKGGKVAARLGPEAAARLLKLLEKVDVPGFLARFKDHPKLGAHIGRIQEAIEGWIDGLRKKAGGTTDFVGRAKGVDVVLEGVGTKRITYVKKDRAVLKGERDAFNNKVRADFLKDLGRDPAKVDQLRKAGLSQADIDLVRKGGVPQGFQVHHRIPLDDGGTNDFSNLVLIKNDPYHTALTNRQIELTAGMKDGDVRTLDFPVVEGFVYPPVRK